MTIYIKFYNDGTFEMVDASQAQNDSVEAFEGFDPSTLSKASRVVYDALVDSYEFDFDFDWFLEFHSCGLSHIINMLCNACCEYSFFAEAGLTLAQVKDCMSEALYSDEIDEEYYNETLARLCEMYLDFYRDKLY